MSTRRKRRTRVHDSIKLEKARLELMIRSISAIASVFLILLAAYCIVGERYLGITILIPALIFMAMAIGYRRCELACRKIRLRFSK